MRIVPLIGLLLFTAFLCLIAGKESEPIPVKEEIGVEEGNKMVNELHQEMIGDIEETQNVLHQIKKVYNP